MAITCPTETFLHGPFSIYVIYSCDMTPYAMVFGWGRPYQLRMLSLMGTKRSYIPKSEYLTQFDLANVLLLASRMYKCIIRHCFLITSISTMHNPAVVWGVSAKDNWLWVRIVSVIDLTSSREYNSFRWTTTDWRSPSSTWAIRRTRIFSNIVALGFLHSDRCAWAWEVPPGHLIPHQIFANMLYFSTILVFALKDYIQAEILSAKRNNIF